MIPLPRELILAAPFCEAPRFDLSPVQLGFDGSPWHVAVASMLLCKVRLDRPLMEAVFAHWPDPESVAASDRALEELLRPLGLHRQRARQVQLLSRRWDTDWADLRDHPGVGVYVADAVGLTCFGCVELESSDGVLATYAASYRGPRMRYSYEWGWSAQFGPTLNECIAGIEDPLSAYDVFRSQLDEPDPNP